MRMVKQIGLRTWPTRDFEMSQAQSAESPAPALDMLNVSVVVTAEAHNPSILHPSFLRAQHIVPDDWEVAEPPLCTPPLAIVKFRNGISFTVETGKLQILHNFPRAAEASPVPGLASAYVAALPHVHYNGVGLNFAALLPERDASTFLSQRFLREGPWNDETNRLQSVGLRLVYSALGARLRVEADAGSVRRVDRTEAKEGVVVAGNYHFKADSDGVGEAIDQFARASEHFSDLVVRILR